MMDVNLNMNKVQIPAAPVALWEGPVLLDGVEPFLKVQSNLSLVACFHLQILDSKSQVIGPIEQIEVWYLQGSLFSTLLH